jgi:nucleotide-binding universal stress UspA family protein
MIESSQPPETLLEEIRETLEERSSDADSIVDGTVGEDSSDD